MIHDEIFGALSATCSNGVGVEIHGDLRAQRVSDARALFYDGCKQWRQVCHEMLFADFLVKELNLNFGSRQTSLLCNQNHILPFLKACLQEEVSDAFSSNCGNCM